MSQTNRRTFLTLAAAAAGALPGVADAAGVSETGSTGMSLMEALSKRRSTRIYGDRPVEEEMLRTLLWCAYGVNRPESGGRTAPSWHTSYGTDIYVADTGGVRRFDPVAAALTSVLADDIRKKASPQPFVATAPTVLIYVSDFARMYKAPRQEQVVSAHVDAGIVAQNVYLYCASAGLGTCLVGGADKPGLARLLNLPETQSVTYVQPVGHPKTA